MADDTLQGQGHPVQKAPGQARVAPPVGGLLRVAQAGLQTGEERVFGGALRVLPGRQASGYLTDERLLLRGGGLGGRRPG